MYLDAFSDNPYDTNCWLLSLEGRDEATVTSPTRTAARDTRWITNRIGWTYNT